MNISRHVKNLGSAVQQGSAKLGAPATDRQVKNPHPLQKNWSGRVQTRPQTQASVGSVEDIQNAIREARERGQVVKPVGAGHSFTSIAATNGARLHTTQFAGLIWADVEKMQARFKAGTRLRDIPALLQPYGLALANQGDVDPQTLAGAVSTGTHGTGLKFTGFGGMVRAFSLVTAGGEVLECSPESNPDIFDLARVGLGAFGILAEITLACVPEFTLHAREFAEPLETTLATWAERTATQDHVEFYWFPFTDVGCVKINTRQDGVDNLRPVPRLKSFVDEELINNVALKALCEVASVLPAAVPALNRLAANTVSERDYSDRAHNVFVSPRRVKFNEMEYAIPLDAIPETLREMRRVIERRNFRVSFPLEVRCAAADDVALSTAYGRASGYIAVHRYQWEPYGEYFVAMQEILQAAGGRPHWGKLHTCTPEYLAAQYPRMAEAAALRTRLDPDGVFVNAYVRRVFGL